MIEMGHPDLDERIIALIEENGRRTNRDIAKLLSVSEKQAGARLRRLMDDDVIRVITVVDAFSVGFDFIIAMGIEVANGAPEAVAAALARLPNVVSAAVMIGQYDIEILVAVENHASLATFVKQELAAISGIRSCHPSLVLDVMKYETGSGPVSAGRPALEIPTGAAIDEVDRRIIERLWENARDTNENIALTLGLSESTVRMRINQLRARNIIHTTAIRNMAIGTDAIFVMLGLEVAGGAYEAVAEALSVMRQVHFVATVLGRHEMMAQLLVRNTSELSDLLNGAIASIPGIRSVTCAQALKIVKFDYRWTILGRRTR